MMGNAQVMSAKILWDNACYWAIPALIFFRRKFTDPVFLKAIDPLMQQVLLPPPPDADDGAEVG